VAGRVGGDRDIPRPGEAAHAGGGVGGASSHFGNPWADAPEIRDPLRRLRGHLVLPVTVWLADAAEVPGARPGIEPVGLTVSSVLLGQGDPAMLAGLISPATELADALTRPSARFVVHILNAGHRRLAQHFAGDVPAPVELLATGRTPNGVFLAAVGDRLTCRVTATKPFGWSLLVEGEVDDIQVSSPGKGLAWYHGAFHVVET